MSFQEVAIVFGPELAILGTAGFLFAREKEIAGIVVAGGGTIAYATFLALLN